MDLKTRISELKNFARKVWGLTKFYVGIDYQKEVSDAIAQNRLSICKNCPNRNAIIGDLDTCRVCGCILSLKVKTYYDPVANELQKENNLPNPEPILTVCPVGKW